jgi:glycosyltransferase involved in cell wall biosynthesis
MTPQFSVIIPTLNRPHLLSVAVRSVLEQTVENFEVLIVNDGGEPLENVPYEPRIRVLQREVTGGPAAARNTGIENAQGQIVTFLDDDDKFLPRRLALALEGRQTSPITMCEALGKPLAKEVKAFRNKRSATLSLADSIQEGIYPITVACAAIDRSIVPRFREDYLACEDWEWWLRLSAIDLVTVILEPGWAHGHHYGARDMHGEQARLAANRQLLADYDEYFRSHPNARAYRQKRIGLREHARGNRAAAAAAFATSFRAKPSLRTTYHYLRARLQR